MKAIVYQKYGSHDVLNYTDVEKPVPKNNEVLVKVHASCVNSWDWDLIRGEPRIFRLLFGIFNPKFNIPGIDIAGRIEAVGENTRRFNPGDAVFGDISGSGFGAFAEYVCVPEHLLAFKPDAIPFEEAAAIPHAGVLALQGLRMRGQLQEGQKILINGAGGGAGVYALQIAKSEGVEVTCVDKANKLEMLLSMGADHVIDYTTQDFSENLEYYDLILDMVAHHPFRHYLRSLKPGGMFVMVGGGVGLMMKVFLFGSWISGKKKKKLIMLAHKPDPADLDILAEYYESGKAKPVIDKTFELSKAAEAFRYFAGGEFQGKIIIDVEGENR